MRVRKTQIPENVKTVAQNIKDLIKKKGLKTSELAVKAQIDVETFRRYVGGPNGPSIIMGTDKLIKIALALDLEDYNDLFKDVKL
ncbi:helix-turn-helix domain-containing protein [Flavobacterium sp. PLA-1-15]|uniref:helix-turn-helix domain-containing protein n=1 Tax=Flavobacterium sp. PLA-1-15 TaxID=3380533 RepID=UPI003B76DF2C